MKKNKKSELIWASTREIYNIYQANKIKCHVITVTGDLIKKFPSVQFLINHCLWPEESLDDFDGWKKAVNEMSKLDNVVLKISGFGEWKTNWSTDFISDYIKVAIDSFGTKRCMFASNFPVDKFFSKSPYQSFWLAYMKIISKFSHTEINDLLMKNAEKYYRI